MSKMGQELDRRLDGVKYDLLELAEEVFKISATWMEEGILEIGEGEYIHIKKLALSALAKMKR